MNRTITLLAACFAVVLLATLAAAQSGPLPTGTVTYDNTSVTCPTSEGWLNGVTCQHATVTCPQSNGSASLGVRVGYKTPAVTPLGTIVIFSHGDGTSPDAYPGGEATLALAYFNANYQVVQTAWDGPWEDESSSGLGGSIGLAACRPATLLSSLNTSLFKPIHNQNPQAGMCVQSTSAGAGAVAYSLAWYGAALFIDKVAMVSGPPLSDVEQGCEVPLAPDVQVCPTNSGTYQFGCNTHNSPQSWTQSPKYTDALMSMREWTGNSITGSQGECRTTNMNGTSQSADTAWKAMSIVDGNINSFNYQNTEITGWLCASSDNGVMNNSSPQGQPSRTSARR